MLQSPFTVIRLLNTCTQSTYKQQVESKTAQQTVCFFHYSIHLYKRINEGEGFKLALDKLLKMNSKKQTTNNYNYKRYSFIRLRIS